ncbi:hypothetical protein JD844_012790, partial [Phrynosoma platyrhinos]
AWRKPSEKKEMRLIEFSGETKNYLEGCPLQGGRGGLEGQKPASLPPREEGEDAGVEQEEEQQEQPPEALVSQRESPQHGEAGILLEPPAERGAEPSVREMLQALAGQVEHLGEACQRYGKEAGPGAHVGVPFSSRPFPPPELILFCSPPPTAL